ncbi:MAG TPA: hypothetical protein VHA33_29240 [Candidatus Angelobacter sp.]|jgi:hypothetical protein|nr:hypothetical protein [Candidatus Angelobacter sp.]
MTIARRRVAHSSYHLRGFPALGALGDQVDEASFLNLPAQFRFANDQINELQRLLQQSGQPNPELGRAIVDFRARYESLLAKFQVLYRAVYGTTVPGLSGLGLVPWAAAVVNAAVIIAALYALITAVQGLKAKYQAELSMAQAKQQAVATASQNVAQGTSNMPQFVDALKAMGLANDPSNPNAIPWGRYAFFGTLGLVGLVIGYKVVKG